MNNCAYSRLETSGNIRFGQNITKFSFEKVYLKPDQWVIDIIKDNQHAYTKQTQTDKQQTKHRQKTTRNH